MELMRKQGFGEQGFKLVAHIEKKKKIIASNKYDCHWQ